MINFLTFIVALLSYADAKKHREWEREKGD